MIQNFFITSFFCLVSSMLCAQVVTVSEDIDLRTDYVYDVLGKVDDKILLYRDKGLNHVLQIFDENLWEKQSIELQFEKKRIVPVGRVRGEKDFSFFYTYRMKGVQVLACRKFDSNGSLLDTVTISKNNALVDYQRYFFANSENRRFVSIFSFEQDNKLQVHLFDTETMRLIYTNVYIFDLSFMRRDFRQFLISNEGAGVLVFEREEFGLGKSKESLETYYLSSGEGSLTRSTLYFDEKLLVDYKVKYDNTNNKLVLAGLYADKFRRRSDGYFMMIDDELQFTSFQETLFRELEKNTKRKVNSLEDFLVSDLIIREDGGVLLVSELRREFSRKSNMVEGRRQTFDARAYVDYYSEDMVVFSIHPDGKPHWERVLRKKQFSQDDGGFFSSFFVFKSARELRFIFNDEIRQDNTVSEYIINPIGENERNIVMNTEYQKLKLRFQEAIQISSKDFIVPSERNNKFNLVKVSF